MDRKNIDDANMQVTAVPQRDSLVPGLGGVTVVVSHAYGPRGDDLVGISDVVFDGYPAITVLVRDGEREGHVHLSPIHGDRRKSGFTDVKPGTRVGLFCPVSKEPLPVVGPVDDGSSAEYHAIYLTKKLSTGECVWISDVWDHYHSRVVDDNAVISYWTRNHPEE